MKTRALLLSLLALAAGALSGCTRENSASIIPVGLCSPPVDATNCGMAGKCTTYLAGTPGFFLTLSDGVSLGTLQYFMEFDNQLADNSSKDAGATNSNGAWLTETTMKYSLVYTTGAAFAIPSASAQTTPTLIPTNGQGTPLVGVVPFQVALELAKVMGAGDQALINVELRGRGTYVNGSHFETGPITIPVQVINAQFPGYTCDTPGQTVTHVCPAEGESGATFTCATGSGGGGGTNYTVGGTVSGLNAGGTVTLSTTGGASNVTSGNGAYTFNAMPNGTSYNVTFVSTNNGQTCTVTNPTGTLSGANVNNVDVNCI